MDALIDRPEHDRRIAALDQSLAEAEQSLNQLGGVGPSPDDVVQAIRMKLAGDLDPIQAVNIGRYLRLAGLSEDELGDLVDEATFDRVLDVVASDAQDALGGLSRMSPLASMVLNRLVEMLGVRVVIGDDLENPEIALGGVVLDSRDVPVVSGYR